MFSTLAKPRLAAALNISPSIGSSKYLDRNACNLTARNFDDSSTGPTTSNIAAATDVNVASIPITDSSMKAKLRRLAGMVEIPPTRNVVATGRLGAGRIVSRLKKNQSHTNPGATDTRTSPTIAIQIRAI